MTNLDGLWFTSGSTTWGMNHITSCHQSLKSPDINWIWSKQSLDAKKGIVLHIPMSCPNIFGMLTTGGFLDHDCQETPPQQNTGAHFPSGFPWFFILRTDGLGFRVLQLSGFCLKNLTKLGAQKNPMASKGSTISTIPPAWNSQSVVQDQIPHQYCLFKKKKDPSGKVYHYNPAIRCWMQETSGKRTSMSPQNGHLP